MPIYSRKPETEFELAPEGLFQGVCIDVIDLGMRETKWGSKHKVRFRWQLEARNTNGRRFQVQQDFTNSLHEKAALRTTLKSWRGRDFSDSELMQFDLETVIAANCQLQIVHGDDSKGNTWANVSAIVPIPNGVARIGIEDYVRECDRQPDDTPSSSESSHFEASDQDVPF